MTKKQSKMRSLRVGLELQRRYEAMVTAAPASDEAQNAIILCAAYFNEQIELVIWALKELGGLDQPAFEGDPRSKVRTPANDLPETPSVLLN